MYKSVNICLLVKRACRFTIHFIHFPSFGLNFFLWSYILLCVIKRQQKHIQSHNKEYEEGKRKIAKWSYDKKSISHFLNAFSEIIQQNISTRVPSNSHLVRYFTIISMVNRVYFFSSTQKKKNLFSLSTPEIDLT